MLVGVVTPLEITSVDQAVVAVRHLLVVRYPQTDSTRIKCDTIIKTFADHCAASDIETLQQLTKEFVQDFLWMPPRSGDLRKPSLNTVANRQWAIGVCLELLNEIGLWDGGDLTGSTVQRETVFSSRPLTIEEIDRLKAKVTSALSINADELLVALALAGGDSDEISKVLSSDIDIEAQSVHFQGLNARTNRFGLWEQQIFREQLSSTALFDDRPLCVTNGLPALNAAHSVNVRLGKIIRRTGFRRRDGVSATSIALGAAAQILVESGLEVAARFLGKQSLDATAKALRYEWWDQL